MHCLTVYIFSDLLFSYVIVFIWHHFKKYGEGYKGLRGTALSRYHQDVKEKKDVKFIRCFIIDFGAASTHTGHVIGKVWLC